MQTSPTQTRRAGTRLALAVGLFALVVGAACEPEIGDECETNLDCPAGASCDRTAPGGYCLETTCSENADCSPEAVCVRFDDQTTYCMRSCSADSDCRDGFVCRADVGVERFCYVAPGEGERPYQRATP